MGKIILGVGFVIAILFTLVGVTSVDVGERVLVVGFGQIKETLGQGLHFVNPFYSTHTFTLRNNKYEATASAATSDIQRAEISVVVNYNIEEGKIAEIYTKYGNDFMGKVFAQNVQEAVKSASAKFNATDLVGKRDDFKAAVKANLQEKMPDIISVTDLAITNVDYSDSFDKSVEDKVKAEQDALAAKSKLEQKKYEAEAIRVQAEAINNAGGAEYVQLKAIEKWNGVLPTYSGSGAVPFINVK